MFLGIDLGTSGLKVVIIDDKQTLMASTMVPLDVLRPAPLISEQNPSNWWQALMGAMLTLKKSHANLLAQIAYIGLSGQMHGATLLDKKGKILRNAILWNDGRAMTECAELLEREPRAIEISGNLIMPGFTAPKLLWVQKHEKALFKKTTMVLLPKDYLRFKMTGLFATDLSDASGTSLLSVRERRWSDELLNACNLTQAQMPQLYEGTEVTGTLTPALAKEWGLNPNCQLIAGAGDNAASAISMNIIEVGNAFLSLGTSGVYFVSDTRYRSNPKRAVHSFCHCLPKHWHQMTVHLSATACLDWATSSLGFTTVQALIHEAEKRNCPSRVIFLPFLSGERTPYNDPYARGTFFGLSHNTTRAELAQAVLEGVALVFAQGQHAMLSDNTPIEDIFVIGGGARSLYWGKILASALNHSLTYREDADIGAAIGAAKLAWMSAHPNSTLQTPPIKTVIEPDDLLVEDLQKKADCFDHLYQTLKPCFEHYFKETA